MKYEIIIKNRKKVNLEFLERLADELDLNFGKKYENGAIGKYRGGSDIVDTVFNFYDKKTYGTGVNLMVEENYDIRFLVFPYAAFVDIDTLISVIEYMCKKLKKKSFMLDGTTYFVSNLGRLRSFMIGYHVGNIDTYLNQSEVIYTFGCIHPVAIEKSFVDELNNELCGLTAYEKYSEYLDYKQKLNYYYSDIEIFENWTGKDNAVYYVSADNPTILPKYPMLPPTFNNDDNSRLNFHVMFIDELSIDDNLSENEKRLLYTSHSYTIPFEKFLSIVDESKKEHFDEAHDVYRLNSVDMSNLVKYSEKHFEEIIQEHNLCVINSQNALKNLLEKFG